MAYTLRPAAPLDGAAVLPDDLIAQHVKPDSDDDRALIEALRDTAVDWVERYTAIGLTSRAWRSTFDRFAQTLPLGRGPVTAVTAVSYAVGAGSTIIVPGPWLAGDDAWLATAAWPALPWGGTILVAFTAGYADVAADAPALRTAALMMMRHLYDGGTADDVPATVRMLCDQHRVPVIG